MIEARLEKYHFLSFLMSAGMLPIAVIAVFEQNFSVYGFAVLGIDMVAVLFNAIRWKLFPGKSRLTPYISVAFNNALPSALLFAYGLAYHDWASGLTHPSLILYAVCISLTLFLKAPRFVYESAAIAAGGFLSMLGFAVLTGRLRLGAAYLGAWGKGYLDIADPIFVVSALAVFGAVLGRGIAADGGPRTAEAETARRPIDLSPREEEIAKLITEGHEHKEIARKLGIAVSTVRNHVKKLYAKKSARNKVELINKLRSQAGEGADGKKSSDE